MSDLLAELLQHGYRYALSLTRHPAKAEDLLQDAWVAVIQADGPHEKGYLFSAIRTRFYNLYRRELLVPMESLDREAEAASLDGRERVQQHDFDDPRLEGALAQLRGIEREVLYLSAVEGYTAQEIAGITGQARGTVLSMLSRIRSRIQRHFSVAAEKVVHHE